MQHTFSGKLVLSFWLRADASTCPEELEESSDLNFLHLFATLS